MLLKVRLNRWSVRIATRNTRTIGSALSPISSARCAVAIAEKFLRSISVNVPAARKNHSSFGQINRHHTGAQCSSASSAEIRNMSSSTKRIIRHAFAEFSQAIGKEIIAVRLYKEQVGYLCEREIVESDGSAFIQVLPFNTTKEVRELLHCDPYFSTLKTGANVLLGKLALEVPYERPSSST